MTSTISIIVPTLNEAGNIPGLAGLQETASEIIIADGGSTDQTRELARAAGLTVLKTKGGRGCQQNEGARFARGTILLFLHADTRLPSNFAQTISSCLNDDQVIAGAFSLKIDGDGTGLRFIEQLANLRSRLLQLPYGDQAIFMRRTDFFRYGPFPEVPIMEDYILMRQLTRTGKIKTMNQQVTTSSRRWQRLGLIRTTLINQLMIAGYTMGISPARLASLYRSLFIIPKS
ncbi:glycosyltransferase family 2 protein [Methanococcoides sp. SA1]|uniref:TIGR04283 family arsenosugar biosynthesis glycosyltransferase n=1 Tax=Candidatus Desulfatifera sulfidica TaxID=2841691 RepID=A0A8J6N6W6_9BACT|nr:TIGR04283 family arsenosugar biosynthesis glycosyltransferase [Candidatus Desulfatifera sulfidica]NPE29458.1 glycosyltransferase family 2 protein [Methanococcoides sp. SA1]